MDYRNHNIYYVIRIINKDVKIKKNVKHSLNVKNKQIRQFNQQCLYWKSFFKNIYNSGVL